MLENKQLPLYFAFLGVLVGAGISMIHWGDEEGVHGTGVPFPTRIKGLPEPAAERLSVFVELGSLGTVLNMSVAAFIGFVIWSMLRIFLRFTGRV